MKQTHPMRIFRLALATLLLVLPGLALADTADSLVLSPNRIVMNGSFNGQELTVTGTVPADSDVLVRLTGKAADLHLREKGKVFGLLWMNVGKITITDAPNVCLLTASKSLDQLGPAAAPFRLEAVSKQIGIEEQGCDPTVDVSHQLLLLKTKEGLYQESEGGVTLGPVEAGRRTFTAKLSVPSALSPGEYTVEAVALNNGAVAKRSTATIRAELDGFPKWLSELAFKKSVLYGVMATVIAIVSGLVIGLVFQSKGAH